MNFSFKDNTISEIWSPKNVLFLFSFMVNYFNLYFTISYDLNWRILGLIIFYRIGSRRKSFIKVLIFRFYLKKNFDWISHVNVGVHKEKFWGQWSDKRCCFFFWLSWKSTGSKFTKLLKQIFKIFHNLGPYNLEIKMTKVVFEADINKSLC